jgi:hypothetical protein
MFNSSLDVLTIPIVCYPPLFCVYLLSEQPPWCIWSAKEELLIVKTGFSRQVIEELYSICESELHQHVKHKYTDTNSLVAISAMNMLVLTLHWLRKYPPVADMSIEYMIPHTTLDTIFHTVIDIFQYTIVPSFIKPLSATDPHSEYRLLLDVFMIIDSTFVSIHRPTRFEERKRFYHEKSNKRAALKVQIVCNFNHHIIEVSGMYRGAESDLSIARRSGVLQQLNSNQMAMGDKGYIGEKQIITPLRRNMRRKLKENQHPMTSRQTAHLTRDLNSERSAIEAINRRVKLWGIMGMEYRGDRNNMEYMGKIAHAVCALCNRDMYGHPIHAEE